MNWFRRFWYKLFQKKQRKTDIKKTPPLTEEEIIKLPLDTTTTGNKGKPDIESKLPLPKHVTVTSIQDTTTPVHKRSDPYFVQLGFDFGTSYSKCICRDMMKNKAWVHIYSKSQDKELPFLIPSTLVIEKNNISHVADTSIHYPENGLYHIKNALVLVADGCMDHPSLVPYRNAVKLKETSQYPGVIVACAVYLLAGTFGEIREKVRERFLGFGLHPEDYMSVNLAVPVEDAQKPQVHRLYKRILSEAWGLADQLAGHPKLHLSELQSLRKKNWENRDQIDDACFVYPEVSANVQGFVRSRVSSPGIYMFSDTGGGTVDQSIFIFTRQDYQEHLSYLAGRVLPLGSSMIERVAAEKCGKTDCMSLEVWRERKESGEDAPELKEARSWIYKQLERGSEGTLALAKKKLYVPEQLSDIRIIFGGGGHCDYPYKKAVMMPFSGQLFRKAFSPDVIGLPVPKDMELHDHETKWMRRLNVAYGLSFERSELAPFTFPNDMSDPKPEEIWRSRRIIHDAPTKDMC